MDFLFLKKNNSDFEINIDNIHLCDDQNIIFNDDFLLVHRPNTPFLLNADKSFITLSGRVKYGDLDDLDSLNKLLLSTIDRNWPLDENFDGLFSGVAFKDNTIYIFNDPIGLFKIYYSIDDNFTIVSTNLYSIQKIINSKKKLSSIILEATPDIFSQYGKSTVLENVFTLLPGEMIVKEYNKKQFSLYDLTIKNNESEPIEYFEKDLVDFINENYKNFYSDKDDLILTMSGGIDSRVNLASLHLLNKKIKLLNYGKDENIDSKIPIEIAKKFKYEIRIIDFIPYLFPHSNLVYKTIIETDSLFINQWIAINQEIDLKYNTILLGDMCDILRAKSIKSKKTRLYRIKYFINKFFLRNKFQLHVLNDDNKLLFKNETINRILDKADKNIVLFNNKFDRNKILDEIKKDIEELFEHIDRYNVKSIESYEELFGIFTSGRKSMGKQLNILKMNFTPEIPILNMKVVRKVLNINPNYRYADELTYKMFQHIKWRKIGEFPTSQNPFVGYNSYFYLMLLGWFFRSVIDQFLLKIYIISKGKTKRQRLVRSNDIRSYYLFPNAFENFKSYFTDELQSEILVDRFKKRMDADAWPLSSQDLIPYIQSNFYLHNF